MKSKVYFIKEITPENVVKIYKALGITLKGNIAMKIHSGEEGNQNYLPPKYMIPIVNYLKPTIVECNTAYEGSRNETSKHIETIKRHGFDKIAPVDIMDADGEVTLPIAHPGHLKWDYVGKDLLKYDSCLVLRHFNGHPMGGFGGAFIQLTTGFGSSHGKAYMHGAGGSDMSKIWTTDQDSFLESMAEAASAVNDH